MDDEPTVIPTAPDAPPADPLEAQGGDWDVLLQEHGEESAGVPAQAGDPLINQLAEQLPDDLLQARSDAAQSVETTVSYAGYDVHWPDRETLLGYCREMDSIVAAVLLFVGVGYSVFGYTLFKLATVVNMAALGVWGGWWMGKQLDAEIPAMCVGGVLAAAVAWPAMRYALAFCGGTIGFVVGVAVWRALGMADLYAPAGGLIGAIFLFMLSFILLRLSIMIFTAVQGVVMLLGGMLGLLMKYPEIDEPVTEWVIDQPVMLPITLFVLSVVSMLFQQHYHRQPSDE